MIAIKFENGEIGGEFNRKMEKEPRFDSQTYIIEVNK